MKKDLLTKNIKHILSLSTQKNFYTQQDLLDFLSLLKENNLVTKVLSLDSFIKRMSSYSLKQKTLEVDNVYKVRYFFTDDFDIYKYSNSLEKNSFFSMSTALNLHGLSSYRNDFIFVSKELNERPKTSLTKDLKQESIDIAFQKKYKRTKRVGVLENKKIVLLTPKYSKQYSVKKENDFYISSLERAFVEMIVNIQYFKSDENIITIFKELKNKIDLHEVYTVLENFDLIYPYFQCIGYFLEQIGFKKSELYIFKKKVSTLNFYTFKNKEKYKYNDYWKMYY